MKILKLFSGIYIPGISSMFPKHQSSVTWTILGVAMALCIFLIYFFKIPVISDTLCNIVLPALSIFTALVFSAIFVIPGQLEEKIKNIETLKDESSINYLVRYRNYIQRFSRQLISIVVISVVIITFLILPLLFDHNIVILIATSGVIVNSILFLALLFTIINNLKLMVEDSIEQSTKQIKIKKEKINRTQTNI